MAGSEVNGAKRMEMAALVTELLESTGYRRVDLAEKLGVGVGAIGRYKSGDSMGTNAQRANLRALCEEHGLKVEPLEYWMKVERELLAQKARSRESEREAVKAARAQRDEAKGEALDAEAALHGGAEKLEPEALEEALRGHDAKACLCSGCALRRERSMAADPTARDLARQHLALLDENVEALYSGTVSYEGFASMQRIFWDTIQTRVSAEVKEALLEMLRARLPAAGKEVAHG